MMLRSNSASYICRTCLATQKKSLLASSQQSLFRRSPLTPARSYKPAAETQNAQLLQDKLLHNNIRQSLRQWEEENPQEACELLPNDAGELSHTNNDIKHSSTTWRSREIGTEPFDGDRDGVAVDVNARGDGDGGEFEDDSIGSNVASPGDLIEVRSNSLVNSSTGIYLGYYGGHFHFYLGEGLWTSGARYMSLFSLPNFVSPAELESVLAYIPKDGNPAVYEALRTSSLGPPAHAGKHLADKVGNFRNQVVDFTRRNMDKLESLADRLCLPSDYRYLSLFEVAKEVFPTTCDETGAFPNHVLLAVHDALMRSDGLTHPVTSDAASHRRDYIYEIAPVMHSNQIRTVSKTLRDTKTQRTQICRDTGTKKRLVGFLDRVRARVEHSRKSRPWTPHGTIGPVLERAAPEASLQPWEESDEAFLSFLEMWAVYDQFKQPSVLHSLGSQILHKTKLYSMDTLLDAATAWTLLQEVGRIPPWAIPSRYRNRLPGTKILSSGAMVRTRTASMEASLREDIASGARTEWRHTTYCIDARESLLIDDGVALERTENPDHFWVHVHVADIASVAEPHSELAKYAQTVPTNIYLPGHFEAMLPSTLDDPAEGWAEPESASSLSPLAAMFSLAPNKNCLTFSAKVTADGQVLDSKIQPAKVTDVAYVDTNEVAALCNEPVNTVPSDRLVVGDASLCKEPPARDMTPVESLSASQKDDLVTLHKIASALREKRLAKGAFPIFPPSPHVQVSLPRHEQDSQPLADPYIRVEYEAKRDCTLVQSLMVLAGETAAKWCYHRGIPVPYRREVRSTETFEAAKKLARETIYPVLESGKPAPAGLRRPLSVLLGTVVNTTRPGPFFMNGSDLYVKVTSPLRRYSDLLTHWQIHAALAHERTTGQPLPILNTDVAALATPAATNTLTETPLPFSAPDLDPLVSQLTMRERMARYVTLSANGWVLQAFVRAWKFPEAGGGTASSLPKTFTFRVNGVHKNGPIIGRLNWFGTPAWMSLLGMGGVKRVEALREGDLFEVAVEGVNLHLGRVEVRALRFLDEAE